MLHACLYLHAPAAAHEFPDRFWETHETCETNKTTNSNHNEEIPQQKK